MSPKISIIMPVYNAEATVSRMIDSIRVQTFQNWELLCVNDGSTDNSGRVLDEYVSKDSRIHIFHKQNEGVSMAREKGVREAKGEYSIHADADDWMEPTMLENLYYKIRNENADIVICDYLISHSDGHEIYQQQNVSLSPNETLKRIFTGDVFGALWNKLIRTEIYKIYNIQYFKGINYCEDVLVCAQILKHPEIKIAYLNKAYYHYCQNKNSISHNVSKKNYVGLLLLKTKITEILCDNEYKACIDSVALSVFLQGFISKNITAEDIKNEFKKVEKIAYASTHSKKIKLGYFLIKFNFISLARKLIKF